MTEPSFGKLYSFMPNGRVFKILAAAKLNGLQLEIAEYQHTTTNKSPSFLSKFPVGKVPAFEGSNGPCLAESDAIAQYVAQSGPRASQLLGDDAATSAQIRQWICFTDGEVYPFVLDLVIWRVGYGSFDAGMESKALARLEAALKVVEKHLEGNENASGGGWLVGEQLSLADLTLASALVWAFMHVIDEEMRTRFERVVGWFGRVVKFDGVEGVFGDGEMISVRRRNPDE